MARHFQGDDLSSSKLAETINTQDIEGDDQKQKTTKLVQRLIGDRFCWFNFNAQIRTLKRIYIKYLGRFSLSQIRT